MNKLLVIADIHSNIEALRAIFEAVADTVYDHVVCAGDVIGYGPNPNQCIDLLKSQKATVVRGNHDSAALGGPIPEHFSPLANEAMKWTRKQLSSGSVQYLRELTTQEQIGPLICLHGTPETPIQGHLLNTSDAQQALEKIDSKYLCVGQTHRPNLYMGENPDVLRPYSTTSGQGYKLESNLRCVFNPGSVGQPRDEDPRASYVLMDLSNLTLRYERVSYPHPITAEKIRRAGLPEELAVRLQEGT